MIKFIKEKDWENILKMIRVYHEEVITIKNPCYCCEYFTWFRCIANKCIKIRDGMAWLFEQYDEPEEDPECCETERILQEQWLEDQGMGVELLEAEITEHNDLVKKFKKREVL